MNTLQAHDVPGHFVIVIPEGLAQGMASDPFLNDHLLFNSIEETIIGIQQRVISKNNMHYYPDSICEDFSRDDTYMLTMEMVHV